MPLVANGVQIPIDALNNASPVIKQVTADVNGLESSASNAGGGIGGMNSEMQSADMTARDFATAVGLITASVSTLIGVYNLGEIGAQNTRLMESGQNLARSYGDSLDRILTKVREASLGTVSNMDIVASSNKAMMLGVSGSADQLAQLMEIAALRGRAMGISTTQAFDDMVRGIGRMSPMILDNLGIVVDAEGTYGKYAESIGKSSSELTRAEKIQALLNKVLDEGNKMLEESGGLVDDNAAKYERLEAQIANYKASLATSVDEAINPSIEGFLSLAEAMDKASESTGMTDQRSRIYLGAMQLEMDQLAQQEERIRAADTARWNGLASMYATTTAVEELAGVTESVAVADEEAVRGAIQVQETYDKYGEKLADLQLDHADLLVEKQKLIDQGWWPESEKIQNVNDKLADNEQAQKDVTLAMQGTLSQMLINTAAAGLDAEAQLALARATGQIDEASYQALSAQMILKKQYEEGKITAEEYAQKSLALRDAVNSLQSKNIEVEVTAIFNEMHNIVTTFLSDAAAGSSFGGEERYAEGTDGWMTVPPGYPNDSYPIMLQSGERFAVIPAGVAASPMSAGALVGGGGSPIIFAPQIGTLFGDENESMNRLYSAFVRMLDQAKADGHLPA